MPNELHPSSSVESTTLLMKSSWIFWQKLLPIANKRKTMLKNFLLNLRYLLTFTKKYKDTIITLLRLGLISEIKLKSLFYPACKGAACIFQRFSSFTFFFLNSHWLSLSIGCDWPTVRSQNRHSFFHNFSIFLTLNTKIQQQVIKHLQTALTIHKFFIVSLGNIVRKNSSH